MLLSKFNQLPETEAEQLLMLCCTSSHWSKDIVIARPYANLSELKKSADHFWSQSSEADFIQAFEGHPEIGDVDSLREKYSNTKALATGEQSSVEQAADQVLADLSAGNKQYFQKFGFIFIVCASGKSASQMLSLLRQRLPNDRPTELINAAEEQRKIFQIRLSKLLETS